MPSGAPGAPGTPGTPGDLTWLLNRAAQRMRAELDAVARAHDLVGLRDWIVLTALATGGERTQLQLGRELGVDKTTLTLLLDRLEHDGLIERRSSPGDRRARVPHITDDGRVLQARITRSRDDAETRLLASFTDEEQRLLRALLNRLAHSGPSDLPCT